MILTQGLYLKCLKTNRDVIHSKITILRVPPLPSSSTTQCNPEATQQWCYYNTPSLTEVLRRYFVTGAHTKATYSMETLSSRPQRCYRPVVQPSLPSRHISIWWYPIETLSWMFDRRYGTFIASFGVPARLQIVLQSYFAVTQIAM